MIAFKDIASRGKIDTAYQIYIFRYCTMGSKWSYKMCWKTSFN